MTVTADPPVTRAEALARVQALVDGRLGVYGLGAGDYRPEHGDEPYTPSAHGPAADCRVVYLHGYKVRSHRPGFNRWTAATRLKMAKAVVGPARAYWLRGESVVDDVNYNSLLEDSVGNQELCTMVLAPLAQPGDIIAYPTIYLPGMPQPFIGHGAMVEHVPAGWKPSDGYHALTTLQCRGPAGRTPAVVRVDGAAFDHHDANWSKPQYRSWIIRPKERV